MTVQEEHWLMKHIETPLSDLALVVRIDHEVRLVELVADRFDSWLVGQLVVHSMPAKSGVVAFFDSSRVHEPNTPSDWRVVYVLAGVRLNCEVGRFYDHARKRESITVVLGESADAP